MADRTLTINHADGGSETYTINRDKFAGVREMQVDGAAVTVDHTAVPKHQSKETTLGGSQSITIKRDIEPLLSKVVGGAAAAYSLRDLHDTTGVNKVVRVRRESDNNERDFTAKDVSNGTLQNWTNAQVTPPLDVRELTATGRDGPIIEAAAAYSLRNLSDSYAGDVVEVRRNTDGALKDFKASEVTDGTLEAWVNTSFANALPLDTAGAAAAAYSLRNLSSSYTGSVVEVRRSSDGALRSFTAAEVTDGTLVAWVNEDVVVGLADTLSEFSTSKLSRSNATVEGEQCYKFVLDNQENTTHYVIPDNINLTAGTQYNLSFKYYIPAGQTVYRLNLNYGGYGTLTYIQGTGEWKQFNLNFTASQSRSLRIFAADNDIAINGDASGEFFALQDITLTQTAANGTVSKWYDQSGNDNHATQATTTSQPKIVSGGALVTGGNKFDGTNDFLTFPDTFLNGSFALSTVFNLQDRDKANNTLFGYSTSGNFIRYQGSYRLGIKINGAESFINSTLANNTDYVMSITRDASNLVSLYVDGSLVGSFTQSGLFSLDRIGVFAESSSYFLKGTVTETLIYNSDQSDKRRAIEENIGSTYGITLTSSKDGTVSKWYDQSTTSGVPNANHAVQTSAASQPKIVDGGNLIVGGVAFDGVSDRLSFASSVALSSNDFFVTSVFKVLEGDVGDITPVGNASGNRFLISLDYEGNVARMRADENSFLTEAFFANKTGNLLVTVQRVSNTVTLFHQSSNQATFNATGESFTLGNLGQRAPTQYSKHLLNELIIYNTDQSDNRTALEANIGEVYGIAGIPAYDDTVNGFVETWYDQSGNGNNVVQLTASNQPKIVDAGSLVVGGLAFDGVDDWLQYNGSAFSDGNISVLSVAILNAPTTPKSSIVDASDNNVLGPVGFRLDNANSNARFGTGGDGFLTSANTMTAQRLQTGISGAVNRSLFINNGEVSTDANGGDISFSGITQFKLGATSAAGSQATAINYLDGAINEIIIYPSDQSANRPAIEANINNQYDIY